jgi:hypothetical protein
MVRGSAPSARPRSWRWRGTNWGRPSASWRARRVRVGGLCRCGARARTAPTPTMASCVTNMHDTSSDVTTVPAPRRASALTAEASQLAGHPHGVGRGRGTVCRTVVTHDGRLLVNEMAPRPHNSGHFSIDACVTSQFEQQLGPSAGCRSAKPPCAPRPRDGEPARRPVADRRSRLGGACWPTSRRQTSPVW